MLKTRVLTAVILIPLVVYGVLYLPNHWLALILAVMVWLGAREWGGLSGLQRAWSKESYAGLIAVAMALLWWQQENALLLRIVIWSAVIFWLLTLLWLRQPLWGHSKTLSIIFFKLLCGVWVLVPAWLALVMTHQHPDAGPQWVLYIMVLIWIADSGAYFAGKRFGRRKLAPSVSPGKTWEGVMGAFAAVIVFTLLTVWLLNRQSALLPLMLIGLVLVAISIVGDLFESLMKRQAGVKDSGQLLPGHGGMLDRIDSLTAAAPFFAFSLTQWVLLP